MTKHDEAKARLATELRRYRKNAGITGIELAEAIGISQSKISKLETGRLLPDASEVEAIAVALKLPAKTRKELMEEATALAIEINRWKTQIRRGFQNKQEDIRELEASASTLRFFNPYAIPGLLQAPEYARSVLSRHFADGEDLSKALTSRIDRQQILYSEKQLVFVLTEAALRWPIGSKSVMRTQLGHLHNLASLDNVTLGVIPLGTMLPAMPHNSFVAYDESIVVVETFTAEIRVQESNDLERYLDLHDEFLNVALTGKRLTQLLNRVQSENY